MIIQIVKLITKCLIYSGFQVKPWTEIGLIGETGVRVSVITLQEQEHGTELDLAPTRHLSVTEGSFMHRFLTRIHS